MNGYRIEPVTYTRVRRFDGKYQDCKVVKEDDSIILLPGDGTRYSVTRVTSNNRINDEKSEDNTTACVICQEYTKNHASIPCGHLQRRWRTKRSDVLYLEYRILNYFESFSKNIGINFLYVIKNLQLD